MNNQLLENYDLERAQISDVSQQAPGAEIARVYDVEVPAKEDSAKPLSFRIYLTPKAWHGTEDEPVLSRSSRQVKELFITCIQAHVFEKGDENVKLEAINNLTID